MKLVLLLLLLPFPVAADTVFAARNLRSQTVIKAEDVIMKEGELPGTAGELSQVVGREAKVMLYAGRPITLNDLSDPAVVERNQTVTLVFNRSGLMISTEGRALDRGAAGDLVRALNMSSRSTVHGTVTSDGQILIGQ